MELQATMHVVHHSTSHLKCVNATLSRELGVGFSCDKVNKKKKKNANNEQ